MGKEGSLNKVMLIGRLGADPDVRNIPDGTNIARISIATNEVWRDKSGNLQERTEWHKVVFFGQQATTIGEWTKKGSKIYVEGSLRTDKWQDKSGNDRYTTEIRARSFTFLDTRGGGGSRSDEGYAPAAGAASANAADDGSSGDDGIPF